MKHFDEHLEFLQDLKGSHGTYKELIESTSPLKKIFDIMQLGITISDINGKILYVNPADAALHGYTVKELLGKDVRIFAPLTRANPMDIKKIKSLQQWKRESANLRKDGSVFLAQLMSDVIKDREGEVIGIITTCEDITDRKTMEEKLKSSEEKFRSLVDSTDDAIFLLDRDYRFLFMNRKYLSSMGIVEDEYASRSFTDIHSPEEAEGVIAKVDEVFKSGESRQHEYRSDKYNQFFLQTLSPIKNRRGKPEAVMVVSKDITDHKSAEEKVRFLAYFDSLTGLPNRFFFRELLDRAIKHAERYKIKLATLFIDIDNFKRINDTLGHDIGDELLQAVTYRLLKSVRSSDSISRFNDKAVMNTLSRLGGDEFVVLLSEITDLPDAAAVASRLLRDMSEPYILKDRKVTITASIGISLYPLNGKDAQSLLKCADMAMYHAKDTGRNNFQYYSESMMRVAYERLTLEGELDQALEKDEFSVHYQAKLDAQSRMITGVEALVRWKHPGKALISPSEFIPLAEETGQIIAIDEWVLEAACLQNKAWQNTGFRPMVIAVNLSTSHLENRKLVRVVAKALKNSKLEAQYLELEITEGKVMKNPVTSVIVLNELKAMGVRIALDDFGTGHSSLNYLRQLPLDYIKIDRSFIANIAKGTEDIAIIRTIIALAHSLNLKVIAEGVETEEQLELLREHQCDEVQGFLFSKPLPAESFTEFLQMRSSL